MTTKPNVSPPIICGRPYVLVDPEQTAEIKRVERKNDAIRRVVDGLNAALAAVSDYGAEYGVDDELIGTVKEATWRLHHITGIEFDTYLDANYSDDELRRIEWQGEVETLC